MKEGWGLITKNQHNENNNEQWVLEFKLPDVLKRWGASFQLCFEHHITKELFLKIKKDRGKRKKK